jgi:hypothetical protein
VASGIYNKLRQQWTKLKARSDEVGDGTYILGLCIVFCAQSVAFNCGCMSPAACESIKEAAGVVWLLLCVRSQQLRQQRAKLKARSDEMGGSNGNSSCGVHLLKRQCKQSRQHWTKLKARSDCITPPLR